MSLHPNYIFYCFCHGHTDTSPLPFLSILTELMVASLRRTIPSQEPRIVVAEWLLFLVVSGVVLLPFGMFQRRETRQASLFYAFFRYGRSSMLLLYDLNSSTSRYDGCPA